MREMYQTGKRGGTDSVAEVGAVHSVERGGKVKSS